MISNIDEILSKGKLPQILLIFGEEEYFVDETYQKIVEHFSNNENNFDFETYDCENIQLDKLVEICSIYPFISSHRIVLARNFDKYFSGRTSKKIEENSPFARYLKNPQDTTCLIIFASYDQLNGLKNALANKKSEAKAQTIISGAKFPYKTLVQNYEWLEFPKVTESQYSKWIIKKFKESGKTIAPEAAEIIQAVTNPTMRDISNEVEKYVSFYQHKKEISLEDIQSIISKSKTFNVFELQKAVAKRDLAKALEILYNILSVDRQEMLIITILPKYFINLMKLADVNGKTRNNFELAKETGINAYFIPEYLEALNNYTMTEIENAIILFTEADETLKSSSTDSLFILQKLLLNIMDK